MIMVRALLLAAACAIVTACSKDAAGPSSGSPVLASVAVAQG